MTTGKSPLSAPDRWITTNDTSGASRFSNVTPVQLTLSDDLGGATRRLVYSAARPPVSLKNAADLESYLAAVNARQDHPLVQQDGSTNVWYLDVPPNSTSPMHRTVSVDVVIVLQGEIELRLSDDEPKTIRPGDIVVQRSTMHQWINRSEDQWVRMIAVMTDCRPFVTANGETLVQEFKSV